MSQERFEVQRRDGESRYVLLHHDGEGSPVQEAGVEAYVTVDSAGDADPQRVFYHTEVSEAYAGQGLGSVLVRSAVEDAIAGGYAIVPVCPYVAKWLTKHPEYAEHVVKPRPEHLRAVRDR